MIVFDNYSENSIGTKNQLNQKAYQAPESKDFLEEYLAGAFITQLFDDGGHYHIETNPLICYANQQTGFYTIGSPVVKELKMTKFTEKHTLFDPLRNQMT